MAAGRPPAPPGPRHVEVAIDAAGPAGDRTWTYSVPPDLADVVPGEAVLVEWGRRRALGVVLGDAAPPEGIEVRPLAGRVRSDGPLLPPLGLALARSIADHYLAPTALVIRAMLPPGLLERLDLVATALAGSVPGDEPATMALLDALATGSRPARLLPAAESRPAVMRRLRALEREGRVHLEWTLGAAGALPRYERLAVATPQGLAVAAGERAPDGRPVGPRQRALLAELAAEPRGGAGIGTTALAARHGQGALAGLARRDLVALATRERPRDPLRDRAAGRAPRPPGAALTAAQAAAVREIAAAQAARDATPLLLDGVTGAGKTAVYAEAIAGSLAAGRPALLLVPEIALALPLVDRLRAEPGADVAVLHSGLGDGERADAWRRIRAGEVDVVVGTRLAVLAPLADVGLVIVDEEHEAAYKSDRTPRYQARDVAVRLGALAGAAVVLGSATPAVESIGHAQLGRYRRAHAPGPGRRRGPDGGARRPAGGARRGEPRPPLGPARRAARRARRGGRRPGDPRHQPSRVRLGSALPRLRPRPGVPRVHAAPRLPPGGHDAALPPLRRRGPARRSLPGLRLAADPVPGRRHGTARGGGAGAVPGPARRPPRSRRRGAARSGGPRHRRVRRGPPRRPRRDEPRREGAGRARPSPSSASSPPTSPSPSPTSGPPSGRTSCSCRPSGGRAAAIARAGPSSRRTSPTTRRSGPSSPTIPPRSTRPSWRRASGSGPRRSARRSS